ncbi:MAG: hypothetical protein HY819_10700 [Acidobacteria bacterium]|nr:hypothetical protein [Acidobacteriota bacterium]
MPTCASIKAEITSVQNEIKALQEDLQQAAPNMKAAIITQIKKQQANLTKLKNQAIALGCIPAPAQTPSGSLVLQEFNCVEETNEVGSDSPYFVVFVGHPGITPTSSVTTLRKESWDNEIDSGDLIKANLTVGTGVNTNTLVLVALLEEDNNPDITGADLINVQNWMQAIFQAFGSILGISLNQLDAMVRPEFVKALNANIANDEIVAVKRLTISTSSGLLPILKFLGDGGDYRVRFRMG